ncbi:MAG: ribbon-helix-helix protein, CopG family [Phycisphaerales bacterium]|nr:ribbon-helix-helix protein, CopG family [Phycisphaerales bacterium]
MHSVRLDEKLEARLEEAVERTGMSASEIIRRGVRRECDEILSQRQETLREALAKYIGSLSSGKGRAGTRRRAQTSSRRTGEAYARLLDEAHRKDARASRKRRK